MLTVLIVTYNRRDFLERCLSCLYETTNWFEDMNCNKLLIWDNGSTDDTVNFLNMFEKWSDKTRTQIIYNKENIGTEAFPKMLQYVETSTVMTLTDDAWISEPGWAKSIPNYLMADASLGAIMLYPVCDERQSFGVPWFGVGNNAFSRPRFMTETIVGTYKGRQTPSEIEIKNDIVTEIIPNHWIIKGSHPDVVLPLSDYCTVWRTEYVNKKEFNPSCGIITDVGNSWREELQEDNKKYGISIEFTAYHAAGPWWYVSRYKDLWLEKSKSAESSYGKSEEEMRNWYEQAEKWSGWKS